MEQKPEKALNKLGLLGKNISYSFSRAYFKSKFQREQITHWSYENFDIEHIEAFPKILKRNPNLKGLNVTIPFKQSIIPYLDKLDDQAKEIGAVNTIKISTKKELIGYNTDCFGFEKSILPILHSIHKTALILGTGGASKAIAFTLKKLGIEYYYVSRTASNLADYTYDTLTNSDISKHLIIINCTPLGTFPKIDDCPDIPYEAISENHILFDLIYNPEETTFLKRGKEKGATICNGQKMLEFQAEKSWNIWNSD